MSRRGRQGAPSKQPASEGVPPMPAALAAAACASHPSPHLWQSANSAEREAAKRVCTTRCPVLAECAGWALSLRQVDDQLGVLGGMSPPERAAIRRSRRKRSAA